MFKYTITILCYTITRYIKTSVKIDFYSKHKKKTIGSRTSVILINNNVLAVIQFKRRHIFSSRTHILYAQCISNQLNLPVKHNNGSVRVHHNLYV